MHILELLYNKQALCIDNTDLHDLIVARHDQYRND